MSAEPRITTTNVFIETQNIKSNRVTIADILVETRNISDTRITAADILVETQEITDMAKHVTSAFIYIEWKSPPPKYTVQMV